MTEVSSTRLYLGNLPRSATKADVEAHFKTHGTGEITEIKLMNGFGFIEYNDAMDARDVVPGKHHNSATCEYAYANTIRSLPYVEYPASVILPNRSKMVPTSWASA